MLEDLRTAARSLRSSPAFTAVALVVLALGIGASTAVFSVVDAVVLRALPFDDHDRLAVVLEHDTKRPATFGGGSTTTQNYLDWRARQQAFEGLAAVGTTGFRLRNEQGEPAGARAVRATSEFFPVLRVQPMLGRPFGPEHEVQGQHRVVILSHAFWQRQLGGNPAVVGTTIDLNEERWEILGVMPREFSYPVGAERPTELFTPLSFRDQDKERGGGRSFSFTAIGRLKDGVTLAQATGQMNSIMTAIEQEHPAWTPGRATRVVTLHEHVVGRVRSWMLMLLGAVALVLLIACANVANLMLARATTRSREVAIRAALGASRWRLVRALMTEGVVLALLAAAVGILLAYAGVGAITAWLPPGLPRVASIGIDLRVLAMAALAAVVTGLLFGIVPAVHAWRADLTTALKDAGRSSTAGGRRQTLRSMLVVAEVALAVMLLVGAGLFIGSFASLMRIDPGFDYHNVLTLSVGPRAAPGRFDEALKQGRPYALRMIEAVRGVPGIESVGAISGGLPLTGSWNRNNVELPGRGKLEGDDDSIDYRSVTPNYHAVMRIPLTRGRYLSDDDRDGAPNVAVINDAAARKYWPGEDPLGKAITVGRGRLTVVGVVGDIRHLGPETPPRQEIHVPIAQDEVYGVDLVMRTPGDPLAVLPAVKAAIWSVNPEQRLGSDTVTLAGYMDRLVAQRRFNMALLVLFGVLGLVIAAVGIYGVMAYVVAQRTREIGVRMALGATAQHVVGMVVRRAMALMAAGLVLGGGAAWYFTHLLQPLLFEVQPHDARIFAAALATLTLAGLAASAVPARRAARVDPLIALRAE